MPTVLVVDDNPGFCRIAQRLLTARGLDVVGFAATCAEGIEAVAVHRPAGVLLDVGLPDGDGYSVAKGWLGSPDSPIVVLTSTDPLDFAEEDLAGLGVRAFVLKQDLASADISALFQPGPAAAQA